MLGYVSSFLMPLVYLMLVSATLVFLTRRSFGKCLPLGMMLSAFLLFFSQLMFETFLPGFIIGILFALTSIPLAILKRKKMGEFKKLYFTSGFVVFLVIYVIVYIYDLNRGFLVWDEMSHWGMMVKEMVRLDKFYSVDTSNLMVHKDYPPIMQLFELFWVKLCGGFREPYVERALHTFELSLIVPFIAEKVAKNKNFWKSICVGVVTTIIVFLTMLFFDGHAVIGTIYVDYVMALIVVYLMMTIFTSQMITWFEIVTIMVGGSFLLLLKQMGLPLYLMALCYLVGIIFLRRKIKIKQWLEKKGIKKVLLYILMLAVPFVLWFIWGRVVSGASQQFDLSDLSIKEFIKVIVGRGEDWQTETVDNYFGALWANSVSTSYIKISFLQSIILFVGVMWLVRYLFRKTLSKKEMVFSTILIVIGAIGYAVTMLMLYVLSFGRSEGPNLASYDRYMGTYAMIMMIFALVIVIWRGTIDKKLNILYIVAIVVVLINTSSKLGSLRPSLDRHVGEFNKYEEEASKIKNMVGNDTSVYLIARGMAVSGVYPFFVQYYSDSIKLSFDYSERAWPVDGGTNEKEFYSEKILPDIVNNYKYLLVAETDEEFENKYCNLLKICPLIPGNMYKVALNEDGSFKKYDFVGNIYEEEVNAEK